jgi:hypothetical protein
MVAKLPSSSRWSSNQQCYTFYFPFAHLAILKKRFLIKSDFSTEIRHYEESRESGDALVWAKWVVGADVIFHLFK